jgi:hypothetical protein
MSQPLPIGEFKWMDGEELEKWTNLSCILEVDLEYPDDLHDKHNEYPLAPKRIMVNKVEKLIPNLNNKKKYVLHYRNLKQYLSLGLKLTRIHRGVKFYEKPWMEKYIKLIRKGVKKAVIKKEITFDNYKECLFSGKKQWRGMNVFRSRLHEIYMERVVKVALSANNDKRIVNEDGINTTAIGHKDLR